MGQRKSSLTSDCKDYINEDREESGESSRSFERGSLKAMNEEQLHIVLDDLYIAILKSFVSIWLLSLILYTVFLLCVIIFLNLFVL